MLNLGTLLESLIKTVQLHGARINQIDAKVDRILNILVSSKQDDVPEADTDGLPLLPLTTLESVEKLNMDILTNPKIKHNLVCIIKYFNYQWSLFVIDN